MSIKGLFDTIGDVWSGMPLRDKAAIATSPVPIVGDLVGAYADARHIGEQYGKTGKVPWTDVGLAATGLLPFMPPAIAARTGKQLLNVKGGLKAMGEKAVKHAPNKLPGYYSGGKAAKAQAAVRGAATGGLNLLHAAYSPTAQGLWRKHGISLTDKKVMDKALKTSEELSGKTLSAKQKGRAKEMGKEAAGQINQTRLFNEQYKRRETLYDVLDGIDQATFSKFSRGEYDKIMKAATGLNTNTTSAIFRQIMKGQGIDLKDMAKKGKEWRMAIRRPYTGKASGNLRSALTAQRSTIYGGKNLNGVKKAFEGKKRGFKTNLSLLNKLEEQGFDIVNAKKVRAAAKRGKDNVEVILTGSFKTDAYELGGANYLTVIKKDGDLVSFGNDANNLAAIRNIELNAPMADRIVSITPPMHLNVLEKAGLGKTKDVKKALDNLADESRKAQAQAVKKLGVKGGGKSLAPLGLNRPQSEFIRKVGGLTDRAYIPVAGNIAESGIRIYKPSRRSEQGGLLPIDPLL